MLQDFVDKDRSGILNLTAAGLTELPPEIGDLTWLSALLLGENQLTALPPEIGNLRNLHRLGLGRNGTSPRDRQPGKAGLSELGRQPADGPAR